MQAVFFGKKGRMSALYLEGDIRVPVTKVDLMPYEILRTKSVEKDGYTTSVVGFGRRSTKRLNQPLLGQLKNFITDNFTFRFIRESQEPAKEAIVVGDMLEVRAVSKGKGWAGVVRKWGFHGGPKTHGQSDRERAPGSIGQTTTPGRVYKGKKMGGRMGGEKVYVKNLKVVAVEDEGKTLFVKGAIPGHTGTVVEIAKVKKI